MDLTRSLYAIFTSTLDANPNVRMQAELDLRRLEAQPGVLAALLDIVANAQAEMAIRLASAVYVKNRLRRCWPNEENNNHNSGSSAVASSSNSSNPPAIPTEDRPTIKSRLLPTLVASPPQLQTHVAAALGTVIRADFPNHWPDLMDNVGRLVKSNIPQEVYGGIRALLEIVKSYRWIDDSALMEPVVAATFPTILTTGTQLLNSPEVDSPDVGAIIYVILKVYKCSINSQLSQHQQSNESIISWGKFLLQVAQKPIDPSKLPSDEDEREISPWYKAKKWACFILNKLFSRYGNPSQLPSNLASYKPFAEKFVNTFAPEILATYLRLTEASIKGALWLSKKQVHFLFRYYEECVKPKSTWALLKPHVNTLVQSFVFPRLCTRPEDEEAWDLDPADFIRSRIDAIDSFGNPDASASSFLSTVVAKRTKTAFMPQLQFVTSVVQNYPSSRSPAEKGGALAMCKAMDLTMLNHEKVSTSLEEFFAQYVIPELSSSHRFLRFRACGLVAAFGSQMAWRSSASLEAAFSGVLACATETEELPIRVEAAAAISALIDHDSVQAAMAPNAARLMQELLKLSDELEMDLLTEAKSKIVDKFSEELMPFSVQLVEQMKNSYMRLVEASMSNADAAPDGTHEYNLNDAEGDKIFAAISALQTIYSVLTSCEGKPEMLAQLEQSVLPLVAFTLEKDAIELYDDTFDLLDVLTFYQKKISPGMWKIFEMMCQSFLNGAGVDYLTEMLSTFDNLVSYGTEVFRENAEYRRMLLGIYEKAMSSDQLGLGDQISACRLADVILLLLKGSVDEAVPTIVASVLPHISDSANHTTPTLRKWSVLVLLDALVYNASLTLQTLESLGGSGATQQFFTLALGSIIPKFTKVHEKKVTAIALMSVLSLPADQLPPAIQAGEVHILESLLTDLKSLPEAVKRQREAEEAFEDDEDDDDDAGEDDFTGSFVNENEDDEDIRDEDNEYLELLAREGAKLRAQAARRAAAAAGGTSASASASASNGSSTGDQQQPYEEESLGEEEDDDDEDEDDLIYESPLDDVPIFEPFRQLVHHLSLSRPDLVAKLDARVKALVEEVASFSDEMFKVEEEEEGEEVEE